MTYAVGLSGASRRRARRAIGAADGAGVSVETPPNAGFGSAGETFLPNRRDVNSTRAFASASMKALAARPT